MANKLSYDPIKVKELRMSIILASLEVMDSEEDVTEKWSKYKKELVLKMAPRVLPTLNAGRDDDKDLVPIPLLAGQSTKDANSSNSNKEAIKPKES